MIAERFFLSDRSDHGGRSHHMETALTAVIYRNNHPPFLLNCYLYVLQTFLAPITLITSIRNIKQN